MIRDLLQSPMTMMTALHQLRSPPHLPQRHHHPPNLHQRQHHPPDLLKWQHHQPEPEHRPLLPPKHRQLHLLRQAFLLNLSTILALIHMQAFLNLNARKSPFLSQPFPTRTQPSLMPTFTPSLMPSMMPIFSPHPTKKSVPFWKLTQEAEWNQVLTM